LVFLFAFFALLAVLLSGVLISLVTWSIEPLKYATVAGAVVLVVIFFAGLWQYRQLIIWRAEKALQVDFDKDGHTGEPTDHYIPVFHNNATLVHDEPEAPPLTEGDRLILLRPSERRMPKKQLWRYLLGAFNSGDWTRDGCRSHGINTKEWPCVRDFVQRWPDVWGTDHRPTLLKFLIGLGYTGTNGTERNERDE